MQEEKLAKLKDKVMYTGFPESLEGPLRENIAKGKDSFTLEHVAFAGKDTATATLHFARSKESDNYFFNSYMLEYKKDGQEQGLKQNFQIGYDNNITFREGVNLLAGRSVFKKLAGIVNTGTVEAPRMEAKGEKYEAWLRLDTTDKDKYGNYLVKQYHQGYGFSLEEALSKHPIKELVNPQEKEALLRSLEKGNLAQVTFALAGKEEKRYIEASPQFKSINQYDEHFQRTGFRRAAADTVQSQSQTEEQSTRKGKKQENQTAEVQPARQTSRRKGHTVT